MKKIFTLITAAIFAANAFADDATLVASYDAIWMFYNDDNEDWAEEDAIGTRTLEQYDNGTYKILSAFGSESEKDVLTFVLTEDNVTFQGLSSYGGAKYIYYDGSNYSYIYDSECAGGEYSYYLQEDGTHMIVFYIAGSAGDGYYCLYWEDAAESDAAEICGNYKVDSFSGWECYWWSSDYNWHEFSYDEGSVELVQIEGDQVRLNGYADEEGIVGTYDAEAATITFLGQDITIGGYEYIFCKEEWENDVIVINKETPVVATINEDGTINFDGWTVVYDYGDGVNYWTYFSGVQLQLSKEASSVADVEMNNENAPVEYYNLNGIRVDNPSNGIYIVRQGSKVTKQVIR